MLRFKGLGVRKSPWLLARGLYMRVVRRVGFEPTTHGLEDRCSIL